MSVKNYGRGKQVESGINDRPVLPLRARQCAKPWIYTHNPFGWKWIGKEKRWLPYLNYIILERGCNGVNDKGSPHLAIASATAAGFTIIRPEDSRLGPYKNYLYAHQAAGGMHYTTEFDTIRQLGTQVIADFDRKGFHTFLQYLVDKQIIAPMDHFVLEKYTGRISNRINRLSGLAIGNAHVGTKIAEYEAQICEMTEAWQESFGTVSVEVQEVVEPEA